MSGTNTLYPNLLFPIQLPKNEINFVDINVPFGNGVYPFLMYSFSFSLTIT